MTNWVHDLCNLFETEIGIYKNLLSIELQKKEAILKADAKALQELTKKTYDLMVNASELDRIRMNCIQDYYNQNHLSIGKEGITLTDFLNKLDRDSNFQLKGYATELKTAVHKLKDAILVNERLMETRQGILQATIRELQKVSSEKESTYSPNHSGMRRKKEAKTQSMVLDASV